MYGLLKECLSTNLPKTLLILEIFVFLRFRSVLSASKFEFCAFKCNLLRNFSCYLILFSLFVGSKYFHSVITLRSDIKIIFFCFAWP